MLIVKFSPRECNIGFPVLANLYLKSKGAMVSFSKTKAAAPATKGTEAEVPEMLVTLPPIVCVEISFPGAKTSKASLTFENEAIASCLSDAETLVTLEAHAVDFKLLVPSFPVAAATKIPLSTAIFAKPATTFTSQKPL